MNKTYVLIILTLFLGKFLVVSAQDTIYYDGNWEPTVKTDSKFYRLFEVKNSLIQIWDYYESGGIQMSGFYLLPENDTSVVAYFYSNEDEGRQTGIHITYDQDGYKRKFVDYNPILADTADFPNVKQIQNFSDSLRKMLSYTVYYYENGEIMNEGFFVDQAVRHGLWKEYTKKGDIHYEIEYHLGYYHGNKTIYYNPEEKMESAEYKWGVQHGITIVYDFDGLPKTKKIYKDGTLISKEKIPVTPTSESFHSSEVFGR